MFTTYLDEQDKDCVVWLGQDKRNGEWVFEVTAKVPSGVRHLIYRVKPRPTKAECVKYALAHGVFSARPYQPGQACDGSINSAALTLYFAFCDARGFDALALLRQAYPDESGWDEPSRAKIIAQGSWEGAAVPETWDEGAINGVLESLSEINYHSLRSALTDRLDECAQAASGPA